MSTRHKLRQYGQMELLYLIKFRLLFRSLHYLQKYIQHQSFDSIPAGVAFWFCYHQAASKSTCMLESRSENQGHIVYITNLASERHSLLYIIGCLCFFLRFLTYYLQKFFYSATGSGSSLCSSSTGHCQHLFANV